jgi:hypothetical protein
MEEEHTRTRFVAQAIIVVSYLAVFLCGFAPLHEISTDEV